MNDLISIIIPVYNTRAYIAETIDAILKQSHQNFEIILVNDKSTDNSPEIIKTFSDNRVKYFENELNVGPDITINNGLKKASGEYLSIHGADDLLPMDSLEQRLSTLKKNNVPVVHGGLTRFNHEGLYEYCKPLDTNNKAQLIEFLKGNRNGLNINTTAMLFNKTCLEAGLFVETDPTFNSDYEFSLRLLTTYSSVTLDKSVYNYRIRPTSINAHFSKDERSIKMKKEIEATYLTKITVSANHQHDY